MTNDTEKELKDIINLIESLEDQKRDFAERIRDIYNEAESKGFDSKAIKEVIKVNKSNDLDSYKHNREVVDHYIEILSK